MTNVIVSGLNAVVTWVEKETGTLQTKISAVEPEILAWAENFLESITPVIKQAATDAVLAAVSLPGTGAEKAVAALAVAVSDLTSKGIPVVENDLKAVIQIAYNALPTAVTANAAAQAVEDTAISEVDKVGAEIQGAVADSAPVV